MKAIGDKDFETSDILETFYTYVGDVVTDGGTDYEIRQILATKETDGLLGNELTLAEAMNLDDESTVYLILLDGDVDWVEENRTAAFEFYDSYSEDDPDFEEYEFSDDLFVEDDDYYLPTDASYDSFDLISNQDQMRDDFSSIAEKINRELLLTAYMGDTLTNEDPFLIVYVGEVGGNNRFANMDEAIKAVEGVLPEGYEISDTNGMLAISKTQDVKVDASQTNPNPVKGKHGVIYEEDSKGSRQMASAQKSILYEVAAEIDKKGDRK